MTGEEVTDDVQKNSQDKGSDKIADVWRDRYAASGNEASIAGYRYDFTSEWTRRYLLRILQRIGLQSGIAVDIGCGVGKYVELLDDLGFRVTGIDYSSALIDQARQRLCNRKVTLLEGDFYKLPLQNSSQDLAISIGVLQHVRDVRIVLTETARILRPGGQLLFETLNTYSVFRAVQRIFVGRKYIERDRELFRYSPWKLCDELHLAGFERVRLHGVFVFPPPFGFISEMIFQGKLDSGMTRMFPITHWFSHSFWISAVRKSKFEK
jgi:2-polyprenyl-3-methyl-5-hydroxy-6-metoxy-1,4-benzoquinol methylase